MRTITLSANPRLRAIITITRRDETIIRVSNSMLAITNGGDTWLPSPGLSLSDFTERNDGTVPSTSLSVSMERSGLFDPRDVDTGQFENALVEIDIINAAATSPDQRYFLFIGKIIGDIRYGIDRKATFDIVGKFSTPRDVFVRKYGIPCDANFGDPRRCKIPTFPDVEEGSRDLHDVETSETIAVGDRRRFLSGSPASYNNVYLECTAITTGITADTAPAYSTTVDATTVDGGVTWTTKNAWARSFVVASVVNSRNLFLTALPDPRASVNSWYGPGRIKMLTGYMKNRAAKIRAWDGTTFQVELIQPIAELLMVGDAGEIAPDCDKTPGMCLDKYNNKNNYRGFDHLTGSKIVTSTIVPGVTPFPGPTDDPGAPVVGGYAPFAVEFAAGSD